jgi:hypothetical protein
MFASQVTDTVTLKDGNTVVVRKLGHKARRQAIADKQRQSTLDAIAYGPGFADIQAKAIETHGGVEKVKELVAKNPLLKYDVDVVLRCGIVSWTLSEKPTPQEIDELDSNDADAIARRIAELSEPPTEDERKND